MDSEAWKTCAVPWKLPCTLDGICSSSTACWISFGGLAQRDARRQVEGEGHGGKLALVIDGKDRCCSA